MHQRRYYRFSIMFITYRAVLIWLLVITIGIVLASLLFSIVLLYD